MQGSVNTFDLSAEQQNTTSLLDRLLGKAISVVDFCRLAAGAFALNVSRPIAAHALRELESTLRHVLEVPMEQPWHAQGVHDLSARSRDGDSSLGQRRPAGGSDMGSRRSEAIVELQFETHEAANAAVEQLNNLLKYATEMAFGEE
jgi:hypothetical protein